MSDRILDLIFSLLIMFAEEYLRDRENCKYDSNDFDSLSNKFLSKLVIKS